MQQTEYSSLYAAYFFCQDVNAARRFFLHINIEIPYPDFVVNSQKTL